LKGCSINRLEKPVRANGCEDLPDLLALATRCTQAPVKISKANKASWAIQEYASLS
jgi:hypothetical protein